MTVAVGLCVGAISVITACSSTPKNQDISKKALNSTDEQIFLGDGIKKNYDPNVIMKRGEAFFEKEEYSEAIVEYTHFLDLHRSHILASYAVFRIGVEFVRLPDQHIDYLAFGWLTMGQLLSLPMLAAGLAMLAWAWKRGTPSGNFA